MINLLYIFSSPDPKQHVLLVFPTMKDLCLSYNYHLKVKGTATFSLNYKIMTKLHNIIKQLLKGLPCVHIQDIIENHSTNFYLPNGLETQNSVMEEFI